MTRRTLWLGVTLVLLGLSACGGDDGGVDPAEDGGVTPREDAGGRDAGSPPEEVDAGPVGDDDAGPVGDDDAGMVATDGGPMACPTGMAGETCEDCATGYQDADGDGACELGCDATGADALDCGAGGTCEESAETGLRACACDEGYEGALCDACAAGFELVGGECVLDLPPSENLRVWLDADAAGTLTVSSGAVSAWRDRRMAGTPELTQSAGSARPALIADARNGRDAVRFDGGDQLFVTSSFALSTDDYEILAAVAPSGEGTQGVVSFANTTAEWAVMLDAVGNDYRLTHRRPAGTTGGLTALLERTARPGASWVAATHQSSGSVDTLAVFASDRSGDGMVAVPVTSAGIGSSMTLRVGRTQDGFLDGDLYEVLIYTRRLTVAERREVTEYLTAKWGL